MLLTLSTVAAAHVLAGVPSNVLAEVNGVPVHSEGVNFLIFAMKKAQLPITVSGLGRDCVDVEVLRQAAVARGIDKTAAARNLSQSIQEDALEMLCRQTIKETTPAYAPEEVQALWTTLRSHPLTQYEIRCHTYDSVEAAKKAQPSRWKQTSWLDMTPIRWGTREDPGLAPGERGFLDRAIATGQPCESKPVAESGGFRVLQFTGQTRMVDPILRNPLSAYVLDGEPGKAEFSVPKTLLPEWHLRRTLETLRAKAGMPPAPALGTALSLAQNNTLAAEHRMLLVKEAYTRGLDTPPAYAAGLRLLHAWALGTALVQADLEAHPPTDADLRNTLLRQTSQCISLRYEACSFPTAAAARSALQGLRKQAPAKFLSWIKAETLSSGILDALQRTEPGSWHGEPVRDPEGGFLLLRLVECRPDAGFEVLLSQRRESLLHQLRLERRSRLIHAFRATAKIK